MVAFNLDVDMTLSDRQKFLMTLAQRLNVDGGKAWRSFVGSGRGHTTGLLAQARYWASSAGLANRPEQSTSQVKHICHSPESHHQQAWLQTFRDLRQSDGHAEAKQLLAFYLSALSGTQTVERFIGAMESLKRQRRTLHDRSLEASMKLVLMDLGGRRRQRLDPLALLSKSAPGRTSGQATVLHPSTPYLLRAQKLYGQWFGERASAGRSLQVASLSELGVAQVKAKKPRLGGPRTLQNDSEAAQLGQHRQSCMAAISQLQSGAGTETILGAELPRPEPQKQVLSQMADAAWEMSKRRKTKQDPEPLPVIADTVSTPTAMASLLAGKPSSASSSSTSVPVDDAIDWTQAVSAVQKQAQVALQRQQAQVQGKPGQPTAFVDSKGGGMTVIPDGPVSEPQPGRKVPTLPLKPILLRGPGAEKSSLKGCIPATFPDKPDIVLVSSITSHWESPEGLLARLEGARFRDLETSREVFFRGATQCQHFVLYVSDSFAKQHPVHLQALEACASRSPLMFSSRAKGKVKRLEVHTGYTALPEELLFPEFTYLLVAKVSEGEEGAKHQLDLRMLLNRCSRCYAN
ncbi:unnamed protein product [Symbiodinium sp. CCMP2592]|nr:unnamed protein product [Symbiodinium sp. CCMP2592]